MNPVIVTKELASIGLPVMRGRDWMYSDQDGKPGNRGNITQLESAAGWVKVKWEGGGTMDYRVGGGDGRSFDLYAYRPDYYKESPRLTMSNCRRGMVVELDKGASLISRDKTKHLPKLIVRDYSSAGVSFQGTLAYFNFGNFNIIDDKGPEKDSKDHVPLETSILKVGDRVVLRFENEWSRADGLIPGSTYIVGRVNSNSLMIKDKKYWMDTKQFILKEESQEYLSPQSTTIDKVRKDLENLKPNTNGTNGNNTGEPSLYKVRRPISTIEGSKRRSRA